MAVAIAIAVAGAAQRVAHRAEQRAHFEGLVEHLHRAEQASRLGAGIGLPVVELPELVRRRFDLAAIGILADALAASGEPALVRAA